MKKTRLSTAVCNSLLCVGMAHSTSHAATLVVTSNGDSFGAGCELREAVRAINDPTNLGGCFNINQPQGFGVSDTIMINTPILASSTIALQRGEITIEKDLIISGLGATIDGNQRDRIFSISGSSNIILSDLTITNGSAIGGGGGIRGIGSNISLTNSIISGNIASVNGGGIEATSSFTD